MTANLQVERVSCKIAESTLLDPCTFSAEQGEVVALTGPNGSGKTTLLRVLAGIISPTQGSVLVAGQVPSSRSLPFRRAVGGLLGPPPLARDLTIIEHVSLIAVTWGESTVEARLHAHRILDELGIPELAKRYPHELSSGQTQLCALAVTLVRPCEVLLLDEPEQRLDAVYTEMLGSCLRRLSYSGATVCFSTHSEYLTTEVSDRLVGLKETV